MIYLYLKTHNKTGLKYLGKTNSNPYTYQGSGIYWRRHIAEHGYDVTTEILAEKETNLEIRNLGLYYSKLWDVKNSKQFANLTYEEGAGGSQKDTYTKDIRRKMSLIKKKKYIGKGNPFFGKKHSEETRKKMSISAKERCKRLGAPPLAFKKGSIPINKGIPMSKEQKELLSKIMKDKKNVKSR